MNQIYLITMPQFLAIIFLITLIFASIQDIIRREISKHLLFLQIFICFIAAPYITLSKILEIFPIIIGILTIYWLRIIGGGDTKVFILSCLFFDQITVILSIIATLSVLFLLCYLKKEKSKNTPLIAIFTFCLILQLSYP